MNFFFYIDFYFYFTLQGNDNSCREQKNDKKDWRYFRLVSEVSSFEGHPVFYPFVYPRYKFYGYRPLLTAWYGVNVLGLVWFGFIHQAGVMPVQRFIGGNVNLSIYIYFACLCPINVKTAELIGPKFCVGAHVIPVKDYEFKKFVL